MIALQYIAHRKTCKATMIRKQKEVSITCQSSVIDRSKVMKTLEAPFQKTSQISKRRTCQVSTEKMASPETPVGHSAISSSVSALQSHKSHCWNDLSNGLRLARNFEIILFESNCILKFDQVVTYDYKSKENICKIWKNTLRQNIWKRNSVRTASFSWNLYLRRLALWYTILLFPQPLWEPDHGSANSTPSRGIGIRQILENHESNPHKPGWSKCPSLCAFGSFTAVQLKTDPFFPPRLRFYVAKLWSCEFSNEALTSVSSRHRNGGSAGLSRNPTVSFGIRLRRSPPVSPMACAIFLLR